MGDQRLLHHGQEELVVVDQQYFSGDPVHGAGEGVYFSSCFFTSLLI
jgi:hypothetical protein